MCPLGVSLDSSMNVLWVLLTAEICFEMTDRARLLVSILQLTNILLFLKLQEINLSRRSNSAMTIAALLQKETNTYNVVVL